MPLPDRAHGGLVGLVYSARVIGLTFVAVFNVALIRALRQIERSTGRTVLAAGIIMMTMIFFFDQSVANPLHAYILGFVFLLSRQLAHARSPARVP